MRASIGIVHPGSVTWEWHESVLKTLVSGLAEFSVVSVQSGPLISRARNKVLELFLDTPSEVLVFTDADMSWKPEAVGTLIGTHLPIVSALYYGKHAGATFFPVGMVRDGAKLGSAAEGRYRKLRKEEVEVHGTSPFRTDGVGMGLCLIQRQVVQALAPMRELWPFAEVERSGQALGEDLTFCLRAAEKGFPSYLHPGVRVGHVKRIVV